MIRATEYGISFAENMTNQPLIFALALFAASVVGKRPSVQDREAILNYHLLVRKDVQPTAADMKYMVRNCWFLPGFYHLFYLL